MNKGSVSLCMIVKNEEHNLQNCLNSIKDYVDEVIIVDTGSDDRTVEIAKALGAVVVEVPWQNNFSFARNAGLDQAGGDWILFIDADEEVLPENRDSLKNLAASNADGFFLHVLNVGDAGNCIRQTALRLFKNKPVYRFRGAIHEQIIDSILDHNPQAKLTALDIKIKHTGYQAAAVNRKDKIKRNIDILEAEYKKSPADGFLFFNLGTEYLRSGEFSRALDYYQQAEQISPPGMSYTHVLGKKKIIALTSLNQHQPALESIERYLERYPDYTDLVFMKANIYYQLGNYGEALKLYQACLDMGEAPVCYLSDVGVGSTKAATGVKHTRRILERLHGKETIRPGISLCMIVRDEERNLPGCLKSVVGLVDEIIIIDTGSLDHTVDVALKFGAEIFHLPWAGDFSLARNLSLNLAGYQWILLLDADEALRSEEHGLLKQLIGNPGINQGYYLKVVNYFNHGDSEDYIIDAICRFFRNRPEFQFTGTLHEEVTQSIVNCSGTGSITPVEIHIDHRGYLLQASQKGKTARNTSILKSVLFEQPTNGYAFYAMGTELYLQGNFKEALKNYHRAIEFLPGHDILSDVYFKSAVCYSEQGQYREGMQVIKKGQQSFPDFTSLWYLEGMLEYKQKQFQKACETWQVALSMGDPPWYRYTFPHGIGSFRTAAALAGCFEELNLPGRAEAVLIPFLQGKQGLHSLLLPYCRLTLNNSSRETLLEKLKNLSLPGNFRESFLLADCLNQLNRPDLSQFFLQRAREFARVNPSENTFLKLAALQLGLAAKYCCSAVKAKVPSPVLQSVCNKLLSVIKREGHPND